MRIYELEFFYMKEEFPFYRFYIKDKGKCSKIYLYEDGEVYTIDMDSSEMIYNKLKENPLYEIAFNNKFMNILRNSKEDSFKSNDEKAKKMFVKLKETLLNQ